MILSAKDIHKNQIVSLWSDAFGDNPNSVNRYLDALLKYFLVYEEDGVIKGMLSVLPVTLSNKKGGYIYAVVTHPEHRGKGICRDLMESVKADENYDFLVLVPQNKGLFDFYAKMDFEAVPFLKKDEIAAVKKKGEYSLKEISSAEYKVARNNFYEKENFIKWDDSMLSFAKDMYDGKFYEILKEEKCIGFAFLYKEKERVFIKELLTQNHREAAEEIAGILNAEKVNFTYESENGEPTFMVYPKTFFDTKFGIFFD